MLQFLGLWLEFLELHSGAFTVLIALAAGVWALVQLQHANRIRKHEFEDIYVQRYWSIMDRLTADQKVALLRGGEAARRLLEDAEVREVLWQYLELCEDEADLRERNLITKQTWEMWRGGVEKAASHPPYKDILDEVMRDLADLPEKDRPFSQLRRVDDASDFDPRRRRSRRQRSARVDGAPASLPSSSTSD